MKFKVDKGEWDVHWVHHQFGERVVYFCWLHHPLDNRSWSGHAVCHPKDTYNPAKGQRLAFQRAVECLWADIMVRSNYRVTPEDLWNKFRIGYYGKLHEEQEHQRIMKENQETINYIKTKYNLDFLTKSLDFLRDKYANKK